MSLMIYLSSTGCRVCPSQSEGLEVEDSLVAVVDLHAITGFPCSRLCSGSYPSQRKLWKFYAPEIQEARFVGDFFHTSISLQSVLPSTCTVDRWLKMITFSFLLKFKLKRSYFAQLAKALLSRHSFLPLLKTIPI